MADPVVFAKGERSTFVDSIDFESRSFPIEWQTDKDTVKICLCTGCGEKAIGVNTFYAPAWAKCRACKGEAEASGVGQAQVVQPGKTDPAKAANLADVLLNKQFAEAPPCPLCTEPTELKSVAHNPMYGPSRIIGYEKGQPVYQNDVGETVMYQCNECKTSVSYSTVHQSVYRRQNEPKNTIGEPSDRYLLGARA